MTRIERQILLLQEEVKELRQAMTAGRMIPPDPPGLEEYRKAVRAATAGDMFPLDLFLRKGGQIPAADIAFPVPGGRRA